MEIFNQNITQILLIFAIVIILLVVFPKFTKVDKKEVKEKKEILDWVDNKDLSYWLIIICLGAISVTTYKYKNSDDIISHWGFAGTIVSIILAVIAIIFTFFQTFSSVISINQIERAAVKITSASKEIDSNELKKSSEIVKNLSNTLKSLNSNLDRRIEKIDRELSGMKSEQRNNHKEYIRQLKGLEIKTKGASNDNELNITLDYFEALYSNLPSTSKIYILLIYKIIEKGKKLSQGTISGYGIKMAENEIAREEPNLSDHNKGMHLGVNLGMHLSTMNFLQNFGVTTEDYVEEIDIPKPVYEKIEKCSKDFMGFVIGITDTSINLNFDLEEMDEYIENL